MNADFEKVLLLCESIDDNGYVANLKRRYKEINRIRRSLRLSLQKQEDVRKEEMLRQYDKELTDIFHQLRNIQKAFDSLKNMSSEERTELVSKIESRIKQLYSERMPTTEKGSMKHNVEIDAKIEKLVFFGRLMKDVIAKIEKQKSVEELISKSDIAASTEPEKNIEKQRNGEEQKRENDRRDRIEQLRRERRQKDEKEIAKNINIPKGDFGDEFAAMLKSFGVRKEANRREQERSIHPIPSEQPEEIRKRNFPDGYKWQGDQSGKEFISSVIHDQRGRLIEPGHRFPAGKFVSKESYDTNDAIWNALVEFTEYRRWKMCVDD